MKNLSIKSFLFHSIIIFSFDAVAAGAGCDVGLNSVKAVVDSIPKIEKVLSVAGKSLGLAEATQNIANASANIGIETAKILGPSAIETTKNGVEISANLAKALEAGSTNLADASSSLGVQAAAKGAQAVQGLTVVAGVAVAIYGATQLYPIGKEIYEATFPSEEQQKAYAGRLINARNKLRVLEAEEKFTECMLKSKSDALRNNSGLPFECEGSARIFAMLGGKNQIKDMTETFNEYSHYHE